MLVQFRSCSSLVWNDSSVFSGLDGSTSASERERLINQFNDPQNNTTWVFLLSTRCTSLLSLCIFSPLANSSSHLNPAVLCVRRAGCLGVNLIGANRVVVFDASWNPCHDAQAVCRVYRYGQKKLCHIYRLVCDYTLEKKIYDRQVSKQGMSGETVALSSCFETNQVDGVKTCTGVMLLCDPLFEDRVVDDLNPVLNFTRKEVESLLHFVEEEPGQTSVTPPEDAEEVMYKACQLHPHLITKVQLLLQSLSLCWI